MRGAPQFGLSAFIRRINWRISPLTFGRPGRRNLERNRQNSRNPARCQETTVSGLTMIRASVQSLPQTAERNPEQPIEVMQFGTGLLPLEDGELLTKSNGFQREFMARQEERAQVGDHCQSKRDHHSDRS